MRFPALLLLCAAPLFALDRDGYLTDSAKAVDPASARKLTSLFSEIEGRTGYDMAIVVVGKAEAGSQKMADALLKEWDRGNLGLVLVLAVEDGEFNFAHAPGLAKVFTPKYLAELSEKQMLPQFSEGKFGAGLVAAVEAFIDKVPNFEGPQKQIEWFRLLKDGKHEGYLGRSCEKSTEKGAPSWLTKEEGMLRADGKELKWISEYVETHDGKPIRSLEKFFLGKDLAFEVKGELFYDEFRVVRTMGGKEEKKAFPAGADFLFLRGLRVRIRDAKANFRYETFEPHTLVMLAHEVVLAGDATVDLDGAETPGVRLKETVTPPGKAVELICDRTGVWLRWEDAAEKRVLEKTTNEKAVSLPK